MIPAKTSRQQERRKLMKADKTAWRAERKRRKAHRRLDAMVRKAKS